MTLCKSWFSLSSASTDQGITSFLLRFSMLPSSTALSCTAYTGEWADSDSNPNGLPDAGEKVDYTIVVTNEGTVTLKNVEAKSASGSVICTDDVSQPVAELGVGDSYGCTASREVRVFCISTGTPKSGV